MDKASAIPVNNALYDQLGERWYAAQDDPVALLRAEARLRNPWVADRITRWQGDLARVLDVGCGAGFLSNYLVRAGFEVTGIDASRASLEVASRHDTTGRAQYLLADALRMPFADASFDAVCAMDFLEHVEDPAQAVAEMARVLKPGGTFFFHTFNRNFLAWLVIIKGVEWFVQNTPPHMHVLRLFIKPRELLALCRGHGLSVSELHGSRPVIFSRSFWGLLRTRSVPADFRFRFCRSTLLGYSGCAQARASSGPLSAERSAIQR